MECVPSNDIHLAAFITTPPNPVNKEGPPEALTNTVNARDLCMPLDKLKPVEEAAICQTVVLVHNRLDAARLAGLDTAMAQHIYKSTLSSMQ